MQGVIDAVSTGVPDALIETRKLGSTLSKRAADILAYFDLPPNCAPSIDRACAPTGLSVQVDIGATQSSLRRHRMAQKSFAIRLTVAPWSRNLAICTTSSRKSADSALKQPCTRAMSAGPGQTEASNSSRGEAMEWLATLGAAAIAGLLALVGTLVQRAVPRELRRARQLSAELETMEAGSPAARLAEAARDDLVATSVIRTVVSPWSPARGITFALIGAAMVLATLALVPLVHGLLSMSRAVPSDMSALLVLTLWGSAVLLLGLALIPAIYFDRRIKELRSRFRETWELPDPIEMQRFSDPIPRPRHNP